MRLADLLQPHLGGIETVVALGRAAEAGLELPAGVSVRTESPVQDAGGPAFDPTTLVLAMPDRPDGPRLGALAARLHAGARLVVLVAESAGGADTAALLDAAAAAGLAVEAASPLTEGGLAAAAVLTRRTSEHALWDAGAEPAEDPQRVRLEHAIAIRDQRIRGLEQRLTKLEASASWAVGHALVQAARNPRRGAKRLPRELYGLWRTRGRGSRAGSGGGAEVDYLPELGAARLYLRHTGSQIAVRDRPVIAGMLTAETAALLGGPPADPRAFVSTLLPHDAEAVLDRTDPDVLLIESAALGTPGPWSYTTQGVYGSRDRALVDAVRRTRAAGRRVLVWWNSPRHATPGLGRIAAHADGEWTLAQWHPGSAAPTDAEARRTWMGTDAPRARLAQLCRDLDLGFDPLLDRRIAVLVEDSPDMSAASLLAQQHRPSRVVIAAGASGPSPQDADYAALPAAGIEVVAAPAGVDASSASDLAADLPWLARWTGPDAPPATWLIDELAAAEAALATVAAPGPRDLIQVQR